MLSRNQPPKIRTLLVLGRISNLPTVWSNCAAGWWLGGGGKFLGLASVCVAMSFFYIGGMFLNDAFDADFDRQRRITRPIPSGAIEESEVWGWGILWLGLGMLTLCFFGKVAIFFGLVLAASIVVYDAIHKAVALSPLIMGFCRFLVYITAASVASEGVSGLVVWPALAMAAYVVGLSFLARKETTRGPMVYWPLLLLATPLGLAWLVNDGFHHFSGLVAIYLAGWVIWTLWRVEHNIGYAVSHLLAGIVLVDLLAVADMGNSGVIAWFIVLWFPTALVLQRRIPAT